MTQDARDRFIAYLTAQQVKTVAEIHTAWVHYALESRAGVEVPSARLYDTYDRDIRSIGHVPYTRRAFADMLFDLSMKRRRTAGGYVWVDVAPRIALVPSSGFNPFAVQ